MSSQNYRKKAQDNFNEANFIFSKKVGFNEAFPDIDEITVEVKEHGDGVNYKWDTKYYSKNDMGEYINCSNSLCYNGGFGIGAIIREMNTNKETEKETTELCRGNEGSPKGKKIYGKCMNSFHIKVKIKYKN